MAGMFVFVSTVGGGVAVVVVAVRLLGLLWFAFADGVGGVERASTLRSILDQMLVGIPLSSSRN